MIMYNCICWQILNVLTNTNMGQQSWVHRELGYIVGRAGGSCLPKASPKLSQSFPEPPSLAKVSPKSSQSLPKVSPELSPGYGGVPKGPRANRGKKFRSGVA